MSYLLYGAYGYTGTLIARAAVNRGQAPLLGGRNAEKLRSLAGELDLSFEVMDLSEAGRLQSVLEDVPFVIHCAGPFSETSQPMVDACLATGTHYLDLTGEIPVFETLLDRDEEAREAGVMLLPGIGFDVVPTDCLAQALHEEVPSATSLEIAIMGTGRVSKGTMKTAVEQIGRGGVVRREGRIEEVPPGWSTRTVDFGDHPRSVISIPWGDVVTAGHSTGIPNVTVYLYLPRVVRHLYRLSRYVQDFFTWPPVVRLLKAIVEHWIPNPTAETRHQGRTHVWARVRDDTGHTATTRLKGPDAYTFTVRTALGAAERVLEGTSPPGYQTPSTAFGSDFVFDIEGVERIEGSDR